MSVMEDLAEAKWLRRLLLAGLLAVLLLLVFQVLQPFIVPVIWSAILAFVTWPLHVRVLRLFRGQRDGAAFFMTLLMTICIVLPIVWLVILVQAQALPVYRELAPLLAKTQLPQFITQLPILGPRLQELFTEFARPRGSSRRCSAAWGATSPSS
jgi:predicted PurR-regulated permease PerM